MRQLEGKSLIVGVSGGIAAYKTCTLVRRLQDEGAQVQVVMTRAATTFVGPTTFQALTGRPVFLEDSANGSDNAMSHITLTRSADALIIAPATANVIAKLAHGIADDLLCTLALARARPRCGLLIAPAMNVQMWSHPATQRNLSQVQSDGAHLLGPDVGAQACGETGAGRMLEPDDLLTLVVAHFQAKCLLGKRVLITAGPTFEPIDPVRGLTNRSSGKMGFALARAAFDAGAQVTLVAGPTATPTPYGVARIDVTTAQQMHTAVQASLAQCDIFIAVAAVADWRIAQPSEHKLKKDADATPPQLQLTANADILAQAAARADAPYCVGFAAESEKLGDQTRAKLKRKGAGVAMMIGNLAQEALGADEVALLVVDQQGERQLPKAPKLAQARALVTLIAQGLAATQKEKSR